MVEVLGLRVWGGSIGLRCQQEVLGCGKLLMGEHSSHPWQSCTSVALVLGWDIGLGLRV